MCKYLELFLSVHIKNHSILSGHPSPLYKCNVFFSPRFLDMLGHSICMLWIIILSIQTNNECGQCEGPDYLVSLLAERYSRVEDVI